MRRIANIVNDPSPAATSKRQAPAHGRGLVGKRAKTGTQPSCVETVVKVFLSWPPSEFTTVMIATEMPAAIKPYSMAVAPD